MCDFTLSNQILLEFYNLRMRKYLYVYADVVEELYKVLSGGTTKGLHTRYVEYVSGISTSDKSDRKVYLVPFVLNNTKGLTGIGTSRALNSKKYPNVKALYEKANVDKKYFDVAFYCMCLGLVNTEDYFRNIRDINKVFDMFDMSDTTRYLLGETTSFYDLHACTSTEGVVLRCTGKVRIMVTLFKLANEGIKYDGFNQYDFIYNILDRSTGMDGLPREDYNSYASELSTAMKGVNHINLPDDMNKYFTEVMMVFCVLPEKFTLMECVDLQTRFLNYYKEWKNARLNSSKGIATRMGRKGLKLKQS